MKKKVYVILLTIFASLGLVACNKSIDLDKLAKTETLYELSAKDTEKAVTNDIKLFTKITASKKEVTVNWESSNEDVVKISNGIAKVSRQDKNVNITLTAILELEDEKSKPVKFEFTILALGEDKPVPPGPGVPTKITIMHGAVHEIDPFHNDYSGREQAKKQELQRKVEKELNVQVVYQGYPASAPWGDTRADQIIQWHVSGAPRADIYWVTSLWVGKLANSGAIVPVTDWVDEYAPSLHPTSREVGTYKHEIYGVGPEMVTNELGIFINTDLLESKGLTNPVDLYNEGKWTWSEFERWAMEAKRALDGDENYVLGSQPSSWAESMIPLNGGRLIDLEIERVTFNRNQALETYDILTKWWNQGLFEPNPTYDSGSEDWQSGKVLLHPGSLWFVKADNRWGNTEFSKGVVPFPVSDTFKGEYIAPASGEAMYTVAANPKDREKEKLAFEVWSKLQLWETEEELEAAFEDRLMGIFDEQKYVDVFLNIYKNIYLEVSDNLGINRYSESAWPRNINIAIKEGTARPTVDSIAPIYEKALKDYLN